jgi:hypothetical protein
MASAATLVATGWAKIFALWARYHHPLFVVQRAGIDKMLCVKLVDIHGK